MLLDEGVSGGCNHLGCAGQAMSAGLGLCCQEEGVFILYSNVLREGAQLYVLLPGLLDSLKGTVRWI